MEVSVGEDSKIVRHNDKSLLPKELHVVHGMVWSNDIYGAKEYLQGILKDMNKEGRKSAWITFALSEVELNDEISQLLRWCFGCKECTYRDLRKEMEQLLDDTEKLAEDLMDRFNPEPTLSGIFRTTKLTEDEKSYRYLLGLVCSGYNIIMRAIYHFRIEEPLRGVFYFRRAWTVFSKAIKIQQKREEKKWEEDRELRGVGIFHLTCSLIPPSLQLITAIAGFEANRESAIKELYECYESGCTMATPSALILVMVQRFLFRKEEEASALFDRVQQHKSFIVGYFAGFMLRLQGDVIGAIEAFKVTQQFAIDNEFKQLEASTHYSVAYCFAMLDNWPKCQTHFKSFVETPIEIANKNFRPWAAYLLGMSYWMLDETNRNDNVKNLITPLYQKALKDWIREDESFDIFAKRKMKAFLQKNSFSDLEAISTKIALMIEGKQVEKARPYLDKLRAMLDSQEAQRDYHAIWALFTAESYKIEEDFEKSKEFAQKVLEEDGKVKVETWTVPYAILLNADIAAEEKKWDLVKEHLRKLKKYSKYDWEKLIAFKVYALKQTLKELKNGEK